jgi:hypothetical protein
MYQMWGFGLKINYLATLTHTTKNTHVCKRGRWNEITHENPRKAILYAGIKFCTQV